MLLYIDKANDVIFYTRTIKSNSLGLWYTKQTHNVMDNNLFV